MNRHPSKLTTLIATCRMAFLTLVILCAGCHMSRRDINAVLNDHDDTLMAIPGVAGVYVGLQEDGKTPCLRVMAVRKTPALVRKIPKTLEGYPVIVEETGGIRPLRSN